MSEIIRRNVKGLTSEFGQYFSGKRVLVTGSAGFLGSWLCDVLAGSQAKVHCLDNLSTGKKDNLEHLEGKVTMIIGDVEAVEFEGRFDYIFHFASRASPEEYQQHPIKTLTANSIGTLRMLELARSSGSVLVYASSSEVYGDAKVVPTPESYYGYVNPVGPRSCYDEGKRFGEALCMAYFNESKTKVRVARIFNSYGPRIREDGAYARALPKFISQSLMGRPITIYGDGKQTRSFCYVTDTITGILKLAVKDRVDGEVFNIGNTNEITILDLARIIIASTKGRSSLKFLPPAPDDPRRRCPDVMKATKLLGWSPNVSLEEGLAETIKWFQRGITKDDR